MRIFYDTEFLHNGRTLDLISIGMVREDGRSLYAVNLDAPWPQIRKDKWLMDNVVAKLPKPPDEKKIPHHWAGVDRTHPVCMRKREIADRVTEFLEAAEAAAEDGQLDLWAWFGAFDHVVLTQLWGTLIEAPLVVPDWTNDLRQWHRQLGEPQLPEQEAGVHNALADARFNVVRYDALKRFEERQKQSTASRFGFRGE